jgi:hypothetical protein
MVQSAEDAEGIVMVSRQWNTVRTEMMYEKVVFHRVGQISALARTLESNASLGSLIKADPGFPHPTCQTFSFLAPGAFLGEYIMLMLPTSCALLAWLLLSILIVLRKLSCILWVRIRVVTFCFSALW